MKNEYFTESHEILRDSVRQFVAREILPFVSTWEDEEDFPEELFRKAGNAGYLGMGVFSLG